MEEHREIEVVTPLVASIISGRSTEAVRVATMQGHVRVRCLVYAGAQPVRLLDLGDAAAYWSVDDSLVEELRNQGGPVLDEESWLDRYRVLSDPSYVRFVIPEPAAAQRLWHRWD